MSQIALYVRMTAKPGRGVDLTNALNPFCESAEQEPGALAYIMHIDVDNPDAIWFYTRFTGADALATHREQEAELVAKLGSLEHLLVAPPDIVQGRPIAGATQPSIR